MAPRVFRSENSQIELLFQSGPDQVFVKREDRIFFSQGTKIRKLQGIYQSILPLLELGEIQKVILQGNLHSNAILAGVLFFKWVGVPTKVVAYARDRKLVTPASILANRFSEVVLFPTREEWKDFVEVPTKPGEFPLPEYLFSSEALSGLESLWNEIAELSFDHIVLDVGSGLTWISGQIWGKLPVHGICLGLNRKKTIDWMQTHLSALRQMSLDLSWELLIEPGEWMPNSFSFGNKGEFWKSKSFEYWKRFGIFFEPIYAAKTVSIIHELTQQGVWKGKTLYVYQGGTLMGNPIDILPYRKEYIL